MKKSIWNLKKFFYKVALFSATTPSQVGAFQKKCPKSLKVKKF